MKRRLLFTALILGLAYQPGYSAEPGSEEAVAVCAGCHGPGGRSAVPDNPILAGQHAPYLDAALKGYLGGEREHGIMKTMTSRLSDEDRATVIAYYSAQAPHQSDAASAGDPARGETLTATCIACHGPQGRSPNPMFPNLAGQHALYLARSLKSYRDGGRTSNPMLTLITEDLSDQDIEDIAAFYAAQSPNGEASP